MAGTKDTLRTPVFRLFTLLGQVPTMETASAVTIRLVGATNVTLATSTCEFRPILIAHRVPDHVTQFRDLQGAMACAGVGQVVGR